MPTPTILMLQLDPVDPPGRLAQWFLEAGADVRVADVTAGEQVPDPTSAQGFVVLGGAFSHADDAGHPFLPGVRAALRAAVAGEVPTLGICLGAQLLAASAGGRVITNPQGPEVGAQLVAKRAHAAADPLFRSLPIAPDVIQWHYDMVADLPRGAVQLASSPMCENQAFRLGRLAWGLQFHIETTPEAVRTWAHADAENLTDYDLARIVDRAVAAHDDIAETWAPFAAEFVAIAADPGAVPASGAPVVSTAAPITDPAAIRAALAAEMGAARAPMSLPMPGLRPEA